MCILSNTNAEKAKISFYACHMKKGPKISSVFRLKGFHWKQTKRMKLFELHKENLEILGIHANQQHFMEWKLKLPTWLYT